MRWQLQLTRYKSVPRCKTSLCRSGYQMTNQHFANTTKGYLFKTFAQCLNIWGFSSLALSITFCHRHSWMMEQYYVPGEEIKHDPEIGKTAIQPEPAQTADLSISGSRLISSLCISLFMQIWWQFMYGICSSSRSSSYSIRSFRR